MAGKVVAEGGMLVVTWVLAGTELDSGLVMHDRGAQAAYIRAINDAVGSAASARPGSPVTDARRGAPGTTGEEPA